MTLTYLDKVLQIGTCGQSLTNTRLGTTTFRLIFILLMISYCLALLRKNSVAGLGEAKRVFHSDTMSF